MSKKHKHDFSYNSNDSLNLIRNKLSFLVIRLNSEKVTGYFLLFIGKKNIFLSALKCCLKLICH